MLLLGTESYWLNNVQERSENPHLWNRAPTQPELRWPMMLHYGNYETFGQPVRLQCF